jgi:hypothetical protein
MKTYTLRGQFTPGDTKRLILGDGRLNVAYRITRFIVSGDPSNALNDAFGTLGLDFDMGTIWNWGDNRQIAWAATRIQGNDSAEAPFSLVDKDSLVVNDLYIAGGSGGTVINYYVELEERNLTDDETVMVLVKERSQDDIR